ncbi:hypothetical protein WJX74_006335 [Apatococcus lobatus]|uniref:Uncharacterized protein n=1 Tax=Apatococcus lobatus TaxID=904363 RepID=A0AAW1RQ72_9CHLO
MLPGGVQQPQANALRRGLCHFTTRQFCKTPTNPPGARQGLETVAQSKRPDRRCQTLVSSNAIREQKGKEAILCQRFKAHNAAVTALLVARDKGNKKEIITASLDKTLALWNLEADEDEQYSCTPGAMQEVVRIHPEGAPVFSLAQDDWARGEVLHQIFCGKQSRDVVAWDPPADALHDAVVLNGHTGWVRALATQGRWLYSAGCNHLHQWDMARSVPRHVRQVKMDKGDILDVAVSPHQVYIAGANGSIRSWNVDKKGELTHAAARDKAHKDRVTAIVWHKNFLYSVSYSGSLKMWDGNTLELVAHVSKAHEGGRIHCAAAGPDGFLYTGGDDKLVRRWNPADLTPAASEALFSHHYPVRALSAGPNEVLVSADAKGEVCMWTL